VRPLSWLPLLVAACTGGGSAGTADPAGEPAPVAPICHRIPKVRFAVPTRELRTTVPAPPAPQIGIAMDALTGVVRDHARDPENPWAVAHAMLALGADFELTNGKSAVDWLFERYAQRFEVCGERLVRFPSQEGTIRIEPHTDLILKALTEAGVSPERAVVVQGEPATVGDLYRGSLHRTWVEASGSGAPDTVPFGHDAKGSGSATQNWNDTPWALQAITAWAPPDLTWHAEGGRPMDPHKFTSAVVQRIDAESQSLQVQLKTGQRFEKASASRAGGLVTMTCGGAHMLQGASYAIGRGFGSETDRVLFDRQIPLLFWRYQSELDTYTKMMEREPQYRALLMMQRLKFLGHFLETVHKAIALGVFRPDDKQKLILSDAVAQLVATVALLQKTGMYANLDKLVEPGARELYPGLTTNEQLYLDYVGDSAHALRGLDLATGRGIIRR